MFPRFLPVLAFVMLAAVAADSRAATQADPDGEASAQGDSEAERRSGTVQALSAVDHDIFSRAFDAADKGDWTQALMLADAGKNSIAKQLVRWRYFQDRNAQAPFAEIDAFLKSHADWPRRSILTVRAETAMEATTPAATVIAWYGSRGPVTAAGMIRLGEALIASGRTTAGVKWVRDGWALGSFDPSEELRIVQTDGAYLTPDTDRRRLDQLIWNDQITAARREMSRVDDASQRIANARIALRADPRRGLRTVGEMDGGIPNDAGLLFDMARAARKTGDDDRAAELLLRPAVRDLFKSRASTVWAESHIVARQMLKANKPETAYRLVSDTGMKDGSGFADAEFLSGWIALRFLKDPAKALPHFQTLTAGVTRPISEARGNYWLGRTYEALSDDAKAYGAYALAAKAPETFYGQLALTRIDATPSIALATARVAEIPSAAAFESDPLVRAMRVLADLGAQDLLRAFSMRYMELHPGAGPAKRLMMALKEMGYRDVALRVAKVLGYDGPTLPQYAYPVIAVPAYKGPAPEPEVPLVHAIIRQETEFDPEAVSHANARGLMQLTLSAARVNAKRAGLPYRPNDLTSDTAYNMQLGMTEFSSYLANWSGSLIVSAAAYNAGETNARRWIADNGDPRSPATDPIDWIERITYGETRNYVQRIVENLEVYRARIGGTGTGLRILADLYGPGAVPQVKVLSPPPPPKPPAEQPAKSKRGKTRK